MGSWCRAMCLEWCQTRCKRRTRTAQPRAQAVKKHEVSQEFATVRAEVKALEASPSNIPAHMQDLRERLCAALASRADEELAMLGCAEGKLGVPAEGPLLRVANMLEAMQVLAGQEAKR